MQTVHCGISHIMNVQSEGNYSVEQIDVFSPSPKVMSAATSDQSVMPAPDLRRLPNQRHESAIPAPWTNPKQTPMRTSLTFLRLEVT